MEAMMEFLSHDTNKCYYNEKLKLGYINIPKVASTTLKHVFLPCDFEYVKHSDVKHKIKNYIVVLRDPIKRYESALNMRITNKTDTTCYSRYNDEHFASYRFFLQDYPAEKMIYFYLTSNILTDIKDYFNLDINTSYHQNSSHKIIEVNDKFYIKQQYEYDFNLIKTVKFVNKMEV